MGLTLSVIKLGNFKFGKKGNPSTALKSSTKAHARNVHVCLVIGKVRILSRLRKNKDTSCHAIIAMVPVTAKFQKNSYRIHQNRNGLNPPRKVTILPEIRP